MALIDKRALVGVYVEEGDFWVEKIRFEWPINRKPQFVLKRVLVLAQL